MTRKPALRLLLMYLLEAVPKPVSVPGDYSHDRGRRQGEHAGLAFRELHLQEHHWKRYLQPACTKMATE